MSRFSALWEFLRQLSMDYNVVILLSVFLMTQHCSLSFMKHRRLVSKRRITLVTLPTPTAHGTTWGLLLDVRRECRSRDFDLFNWRLAFVTFMQIISKVGRQKVCIVTTLCSFMPMTLPLFYNSFLLWSSQWRLQSRSWATWIYLHRRSQYYTGETKTQTRYRPKWERPALDHLFITWVVSGCAVWHSFSDSSWGKRTLFFETHPTLHHCTDSWWDTRVPVGRSGLQKYTGLF